MLPIKTSDAVSEGVIADSNPAVNQLGLNSVVINGVEVFGSLQIATYGPPQNVLNSSSCR